MSTVLNQAVRPQDAAQQAKGAATRKTEATARAALLFPGATADPSPTYVPDYAGKITIVP